MNKTQLQKIFIENFRALNGVEIEFADHITVICGKNGTSKSSILGIAAQIFSFEKDYVKNEQISFQQISGAGFKSQYRDHFRMSDAFDLPGSMKVDIELNDGYTRRAATGKLELMRRGESPRPVVRNNSTATGNTSRNFTHPVIYLSLKRLFPIADREYNVINFDYLREHEQEFIDLTNELLNRDSARATGTGGTISSAVAHGDNYDQESVSAGEDNAGQIVLAIMSFRKLKEEYSDYKGGLLLIDEADASLFPTAQINLLKILERECRDLDLQVVMTSHSPTLIEYAFEQSQKFRKRYKTIYLSNTYGTVQVMQDMSWMQINADIHTRTIALSPDVSLPKINIYFEDNEGFDLFKAILFRQPINKFINPLKEITLGCSNYINLIQKRVAEFSQKSLICLDADVRDAQRYETVILLPGHLPPDQLIFEYLYNLPADHSFWRNPQQFTRQVFTNAASELISTLSIRGASVNIEERITTYQANQNQAAAKKPREMFKRFYKEETIRAFIESKQPWNSWISDNRESCDQFLSSLLVKLRKVMKSGHSVDEAKLVSLRVQLRGR
ncbi:ATP-dependent nuclease [Cellvibrio fontiphilus]|uniref:ATP-dependent endonuclease n=1 Tax=Cellvibrio fontiphilus TaxID=1815559 RepID=A0ABV7FMC6_9GAMM